MIPGENVLIVAKNYPYFTYNTETYATFVHFGNEIVNSNNIYCSGANALNVTVPEYGYPLPEDNKINVFVE